MKSSLFFLIALTALAGCASRPPVVAAKAVDLPRYMGDWFVIANIPYWGEKDCFSSLERYRLQPDGLVDTQFMARKRSFDGPEYLVKSVARVTDRENNSRWDVLFLGGLIKVKLIILHVAPDYRFAVVTTPDRKLAWIFSRKTSLSARDYESAVNILKTSGIDTSRLMLVPQKPAL